MIANAADADEAGLISATSQTEIDQGLSTVPKECAAWHRSSRFQAIDLRRCGNTVKQSPASTWICVDQRVGDFETHPAAASHGVEIGIDEIHPTGDHAALPRRCCHAGLLTHLQPLAIRFVGGELHPHGGKIGRFEKSLSLGDVLAFVHLLEHHRSISRNQEFARDGSRRLVWERIDLRSTQTHLKQSLPGRRKNRNPIVR